MNNFKTTVIDTSLAAESEGIVRTGGAVAVPGSIDDLEGAWPRF